MRKTVEVQMDAGMEARPIALMVQTANQFSSHLYLEMDGKHVNAKSIMGIMAFNPSDGMSVDIVTNGNDEPCSDKRSGCHDRCGRNRRSGSSGSIRETFDRQINVE